MTKPRTLNWYQTAEEFLENMIRLGKYDEDYLTKEHIPDIAQDFKIEYSLDEEVAYKYIDKAVRKRLGWLPCIVCGEASVMQTGDTPRRFYCSDHIPPFTIEKPEPESPEQSNYLATTSNETNETILPLIQEDPELSGKKLELEEPQEESLATNSIESTYTINGKKVLQDQGEGSSDDFYEVVKKSQKTTISAKTPGLLKRYKFCGKKNCRCRKKGQKHGPYYYQNIRDPETGKQKQIYIGRAPR